MGVCFGFQKQTIHCIRDIDKSDENIFHQPEPPPYVINCFDWRWVGVAMFGASVEMLL